jgi:hypothetical protein
MPQDCRPFFKVSSIEDYVMETNNKYDFIYALDVVEHVGCRDLGTVLEEDAEKKRCRFLSSCFAALNPRGVLLLSTSNRLCPMDIGHWHKYHWLGRLAMNRKDFGVSLPWRKDNFLLSGTELKRLMTTAVGTGCFYMEYVNTADYPTLSGRKSILRPFLRLVDLPFLIGSPFSPILVVKFTKLGT